MSEFCGSDRPLGLALDVRTAKRSNLRELWYLPQVFGQFNILVQRLRENVTDEASGSIPEWGDKYLDAVGEGRIN